jgi:hypothetical protein
MVGLRNSDSKPTFSGTMASGLLAKFQLQNRLLNGFLRNQQFVTRKIDRVTRTKKLRNFDPKTTFSCSLASDLLVKFHYRTDYYVDSYINITVGSRYNEPSGFHLNSL